MAGAATGAIVLGAGAAWAQSKSITIEPQPLMSALHDFGSQTGNQVFYTPEILEAKVSGGVAGAADEQSALTRILEGTGLTFRREANAYIIVRQGEGGSSPQAESAGDVDALIVTAQKKEEAIQDVPIAISAFTQKSLDAQKIEGGFDLLKAIPNVTFSKSNFSGYNFSIRGIGTKAVSATTDPGVAVAFNNSTLIVNRLFEQEYFDVERVEVLRGPQGTLYGRNATGGVINVLSARPRLGEFEGNIKLETGNYEAKRARGMVNIPIGDTLAIRAAGALTQRLGYGINQAASDPLVINKPREDVDGRDLWSARVTVGWEPIEQIRVNALWERFEEDDNRVRTSKQLCHHDAGPQTIGEFDWADTTFNAVERAMTSQGCLAGSLYDDAAFGTPNGASLPYVRGLYEGPNYGAWDLAGNVALHGLGGNPYWDPDGPGPRTAFIEDAPCLAMTQGSIYFPLNLCQPDPYGNAMQSRDLRTIHSAVEPTYRAKADIFELSLDMELTDSVTLSAQTVYSRDSYYASQDYNRYTTFPMLNDSSVACNWALPPFGFQYQVICDGSPYAPTDEFPGGFYNVTPRLPGSPVGSPGVFNDPQLGPSSSLLAQDLSQSESEQFNQEFRLASNFDGTVNFSLGANFTRFETMNDYYVFLNAASLLTHFYPFNVHVPTGFANPCKGGPNLFGVETPDPWNCLYVDPNPLESINGEGHNYFRSANPYELTSSAIFGELYWQATETLKVTVGARMTWDQKVFTPIPSQLLLMDYRYVVRPGGGPEECVSLGDCQLTGTGVAGRGSPADPEIVQEWREPTGRMIVDWKPDLGFTDESMLYASYSHGYKGGGANPPSVAPPSGLYIAAAAGAAARPTFDPEFVDAFELGTKNTLLGGGLILNGAAFYYDYQGYQVSKIVDRSAANENFDATVWGLEIEGIFSPTRALRFNFAFGYLDTEIAEGERSIDLMDRTQGGSHSSYLDVNGVEHALGYDEWMVVKPWVTGTSNCVVPVALVERLYENGQPVVGYLCAGGGVIGNSFVPGGQTLPGPGPAHFNPLTEAPNAGAGFFDELGGNELPNAPHWTASLGAQYSFGLPGGWDATLRGDFYWQGQSFHRVYNTQYDKLRAWTNANLSLWFEHADWGLTAEVYVKNVFDEMPITDAFLNSDDAALTTNVFTLDPRLVGVSVRKRF